MKALSQDINWLKIIGITLVLSATFLLSRCSKDFTQRSQVNAEIWVQVVCQHQSYNYERTGQLVEDVRSRGWFVNAYPEFYDYSTRRSGNKMFHYATSKSPHLKSYVGLVVGLSGNQQRRAIAQNLAPKAIAILCKTEKPGVTPATDPIFDNSKLTCGSQTRQVNVPLGFSS